MAGNSALFKKANALMRKGYTRKQAFAALSTVKKNPVRPLRTVKRKTRATTLAKAKAYVRRPSQASGKAPTKRLAVRRTKNLRVPVGVFPNPMTTAKMRQKALLYEDKLDWEHAAQCWEDAVKLYSPGNGQLRERDILNMRSRAKDCRSMLKTNPREIMPKLYSVEIRYPTRNEKTMAHFFDIKAAKEYARALAKKYDTCTIRVIGPVR